MLPSARPSVRRSTSRIASICNFHLQPGVTLTTSPKVSEHGHLLPRQLIRFAWAALSFVIFFFYSAPTTTQRQMSQSVTRVHGPPNVAGTTLVMALAVGIKLHQTRAQTHLLQVLLTRGVTGSTV